MFTDVIQAVFAHIKKPQTGFTSLFAGSTVFCSVKHRLTSVMLTKAAAILIVSGEKRITMQSESMAFAAGSMFMLPPMVECTVENTPDPATGQYVALCLSFDDAMLTRAGVSAAGGGAPALPHLRDFQVRMDSQLMSAVRNFISLPPLCPDESRVQELYLEAVLTLIAQRSSCLPWLWGRSATWSARCALIVSLDPERKWTANDIGDRLALSERSLRRFLHAEGTSLRRILQGVRLNVALGLLQSRAGNVAEVAGRCGYDSSSRFAVLFKQRFGVSPAEVLRFNAVSEHDLAVC